MLTSTERVARTRIRVSPSEAGPCRVRTAISHSDATAAAVRPMLTSRGSTHARISLVPEGALLLAGDTVEIDITVDPGGRLDLDEPSGTVAFDMRGGTARWHVRVELGADAVLTWAGQPFVVSAGADVDRSLQVRYAPGARLAIRETLVLGRYGEPPGTVRQTATVLERPYRPVLLEDLPLDADSATWLLGGHRVMTSVLYVGDAATSGIGPGDDRYDLDTAGAVLWRRLGIEAHEAAIPDAWSAAVRALG